MLSFGESGQCRGKVKEEVVFGESVHGVRKSWCFWGKTGCMGRW